MPFKSLYEHLDIPQTNVLTYLFGNGSAVSHDPIWIDAKNPEKSLSPHQLLLWVRRLGLGLQRLGLKRGDVAMICTPNHIFVPVAYLGIAGSGCIFSGANPVFTVPELSHQLSNTDAKAVFAHPSVLGNIVEAAAKVGIPKSRIFQFSDEENPVREGIQDWRCILPPHEEAYNWQWPLLSPHEAKTTVATINFSSGTTGLPKGVCVPHSSLIANVEQAVHLRHVHRLPEWDLLPRNRWIGFLPLYHAYGQLYACLMAGKILTPIYIMAKFNYEEFLSTIERYKVTQLQVAPPIIVMLTKRPETTRYDLSSLRHVMCGAAPLSRELQMLCQEKFHVRLTQGYGMTELTCSGITFAEGLDGDNGGSVGRLLPNSECKLLDDDGKEVEVGAPGELYIRGPNVCLGYWKNEAATRECLDKDGWFRTGDIAVCNNEGLFSIVDRKKELIKVNGMQVAPAELEAVLLENEHVADAAVVEIRFGEDEWPRAYVVIQPGSKGKVTPKDIQDWTASRVAKHKRLVGGVTFIDEVPKLASGKIIRKLMKQWSKRDAEEMMKNGAVPVRAKL
ncbi:4-coumarate- ligase 2 [Trichoderma arundinaceum]|uniref:4-coumarate-ligase 2 n=1 Tax=Trichoderma arundinaceum TaxID=490622 RepID=A0A395NLN4_TRIAR|nr:4-coumarate- ligase 2 [Trichoderma arundinaceum]